MRKGAPVAGFGQRVIRLAEVSSTIDAARALADAGAIHGTAVVADRQAAGRGRRGRTWMTMPGTSLAVTLIIRELPPVERLGLAGMAAAVAFVRAARTLCGVELGLKWPNDVVAGGRKVAGTLGETYGDALLLSIGANVNGLAADLPEDLRAVATTLEAAAGHCVHRELLLDRVLLALDEVWATLLARPDDLIAEWDTLDTTLGAEVIVCGADGRSIEGRAMGVDECGRLRLRTADGKIQTVSAGDVTVVPPDEGPPSAAAEPTT